ncbi:three-helix bundle dimerization domain-containing protein [Kocuria sp. M1R5S2]|uniref:three-helix bundle dimerization domain-containing protein n=1 Tax=Kocuria rhizosphaerae TaxID=3376285 RepID=UPI00378DAE16
MAERGVDLTDPRMLRRTAEHLSTCFAGTFFPELVERCVAECYAELARTARLPSYLAPIAVHAARDRLRALATARSGTGPAPAEPPVRQVLFVDDRDAGPAAVAAALLGELAGREVVTRSAGTAPADTMDPSAVQFLADHGVPAPMAAPKPMTRELLLAADWVITFGDQDLGALGPGTTCQTWPAQATPQAHQWPEMIADLQARVHALQLEITPFATEQARTG